MMPLNNFGQTKQQHKQTMSHLIASKIVINDLDILRKAVAGFGGLIWKEGQKDFRWYNRGENAAQLVKEGFGFCDHAISIKGATYEVGVVRNKNGEGWSLVFDPYDGVAADKVGRGCEKIIEAYSQEYIRDFAEKNGYMVQHGTDDEGNIVLELVSNS